MKKTNKISDAKLAKLDPSCVYKEYKLTEKQIRFIVQHTKNIDWSYLSRTQYLSEDFIREHANQINWSKLPYDQKLSEEFIREFADKINWGGVAYQSVLSENFIREFSHLLDWRQISANQKLSNKFIKEFIGKINFYYLGINRKIPKKNKFYFWKEIVYHQFLKSDEIEELIDENLGRAFLQHVRKKLKIKR